MPHIEQAPNGVYVRRLNNIEEQIINRLYQEVSNREAEVSALTVRIETLETQMATVLTEMNNFKMRIQALETKTV